MPWRLVASHFHEKSTDIFYSIRTLFKSFYGNSEAGKSKAIWKLCGDREVLVQLSCGFCMISMRPPRDARAGIVRCLLRHVYGLHVRGYEFFKICHKSSLNKSIEATAPVNPCENRRPLCASARRPHGKGNTCRKRTP